MRQADEKKFSFGTKFMLILSAAVLVCTLAILIRLSLGGVQPAGGRTAGAQPAAQSTAPVSGAAATAAPKQDGTGNTEGTPEARTMSVTFAGTAVLDGEVRKNGYFNDARIYDFSENLTLLKRELKSDLNVAFIENILSDEWKTNDLIVPATAADMLKNAGFQAAACGFAKAYDKGIEGIASTRNMLTGRGIRPLGIFESEADDRLWMTETNGIRIAMLQVTDTMTASARKKMASKDFAEAVPAAKAEEIAGEITRARDAGAQAVIVLVQWGKAGKAADKNQQLLAQQIAEAGADLIVGAGSRVPQAMTLLQAPRADGSVAEVPCVWSLGTMLSGDRSVKRLGGILLHTVLTAENGKVSVALSYTPLYTWKYKQDGRYYYRSLAANRGAPDGMDNDQQKNMESVLKNVRDAMKDTLPEE